ncbi:hypothetical protein S245_055739, partial [Arachis hypogaea]
DGHIRIMEWPSMNNILDEPRAHKSVRDMDFRQRKLEDTFQENSNWLKLLASYEDSPAGVFDEAQPVNVPTSFKHRAMLVDEIWHAA